MPEPPYLAPLDAEEQQLYSELLPVDGVAYPMSKGGPGHPERRLISAHACGKKGVKPLKAKTNNFMAKRQGLHKSIEATAGNFYHGPWQGSAATS